VDRDAHARRTTGNAVRGQRARVRERQAGHGADLVTANVRVRVVDTGVCVVRVRVAIDRVEHGPARDECAGAVEPTRIRRAREAKKRVSGCCGAAVTEKHGREYEREDAEEANWLFEYVHCYPPDFCPRALTNSRGQTSVQPESSLAAQLRCRAFVTVSYRSWHGECVDGAR